MATITSGVGYGLYVIAKVRAKQYLRGFIADI
jgi:hypothetical protein